MDKQRDWIALSMAPGLGPAGFWCLVEAFGSPSGVLDKIPQALASQKGLSKSQLSGLRNPADLRSRADRELAGLKRIGAEAVVADDPVYPPLLKKTSNPPPVLYIKGDRNSLNTSAVAVIGSRAASGYGRRIAFNMGQNLSRNGITVVSGLATGIDAEAHKGVINSQGTAIGVLGCGLDVVYPRSHKKLYHQVAQRGALVSEYPLGTKPEGFRFPARNRIIAGMSHGTVVVEAARKSGSLITVQHALDEGREVFAVPGQVDSAKSTGTHWLLQQGATLATSAEDVMMGLGLEKMQPFEHFSSQSDTGDLEGKSAALLAAIDTYPMSRDDLIKTSGYSPAEISEYLLLLELDGLIEILPGDQLRRVA